MLNSMMDAISIKPPDNCMVILTIRFKININGFKKNILLF